MVRTIAVFLFGLGAGLALSASGRAQDTRLPGMNGVNHLAFATANYDAMRRFYTETLGLQDAFSNRNPAGLPTLTYFQASRSTFVELMPAGQNRTPGFTHFGLHVDDVRAVAERLRQRGLTVPEPRIIGSGSLTVAITDPDGNRIEVSELPADAPARKAMEAWR